MSASGGTRNEGCRACERAGMRTRGRSGACSTRVTQPAGLPAAWQGRGTREARETHGRVARAARVAAGAFGERGRRACNHPRARNAAHRPFREQLLRAQGTSARPRRARGVAGVAVVPFCRCGGATWLRGAAAAAPAPMSRAAAAPSPQRPRPRRARRAARASQRTAHHAGDSEACGAARRPTSPDDCFVDPAAVPRCAPAGRSRAAGARAGRRLRRTRAWEATGSAGRASLLPSARRHRPTFRPREIRCITTDRQHNMRPAATAASLAARARASGATPFFASAH